MNKPNSHLPSPISRAAGAPLQVEELTDDICRAHRCQLEYALKAMKSLLLPGDYAPSRGKGAEDLITERHGLGLDPYLPDYVLDKIKKAVRS